MLNCRRERLPLVAFLLLLALCDLPLRAQVKFVRGDADPSGIIDLSDPVLILSYLFLGERPPACLDAADADESGRLDLTDPIYILSYLFVSGPPPLQPGRRSFDVCLEGQRVLADYDPRGAGYTTADERRLEVEVQDGLLDIELVPVIENPKVSAIEIEGVR